MRPHIDGTRFGSVCVGGETYEHDIVIRLNGKVKKRKKKLSKAVHGTSHIVSVDEAEHIYDKGARRLIVGSGHYGALTLSDEAKRYFEKKDCKVRVKPTPAAIAAWNDAKAGTIAMFHVTC
jgi:hypothetical protein